MNLSTRTSVPKKKGRGGRSKPLAKSLVAVLEPRMGPTMWVRAVIGIVFCDGHGMDTPRNQHHSRFGNQRPEQVGGYWSSVRRDGLVLPGLVDIEQLAATGAE